MSSSINLAGHANLVSVVNQSITTEEIYTFIHTHRNLSQEEPLKIDPSDGEWLFLPVLQDIIDNPNTPTAVRATANKMYQYEHARNW